MKIPQTAALVILFTILLSCDQAYRPEKGLITGIAWTVTTEPLSPATKVKLTEKHIFHEDGNYSCDAGRVKLKGQWKWCAQNEINLQVVSIEINGTSENFTQSQNSYLRILDISESSLLTLERFEGDSWESGFAKKKNYSRVK